MAGPPHYYFGRLEVRILSAKDLRNVALLGKMSPYAKVTLNRNVYETAIHHGGDRNPVWNEGAAVWDVKCSLRDEFSIQLKHKSGLHSSVIGRWVSDFRQILQLAASNGCKWLQLLTEDSFRPAGMVAVELKWQAQDDDSVYNPQSGTLTAPIPAVTAMQYTPPAATAPSVTQHVKQPSADISATVAAAAAAYPSIANSNNHSLPAPLPSTPLVPTAMWTNPPASNPSSISHSNPSASSSTPSPPPSISSATVSATWDCDECTYAGNKPTMGVCEVCGALRKSLRIARDAENKAAEDAAKAAATAAPITEAKSPMDDANPPRADPSAAYNDSASAPLQTATSLLSPPPPYSPNYSLPIPPAAAPSIASSPTAPLSDASAQCYQLPVSGYQPPVASYQPAAVPYGYCPPQPEIQPAATPYGYPQHQARGYGQYYAQPQQPAYGYQPPHQPHQSVYGYQPNAYAYNQFNY